MANVGWCLCLILYLAFSTGQTPANVTSKSGTNEAASGTSGRPLIQSQHRFKPAPPNNVPAPPNVLEREREQAEERENSVLEEPL